MNLPISRRSCRCVAYAHLLVILTASTATFAATSELDEIVVTAQKREQSLQEVPISVSAITADEIIARSMRNLGDLATEVPGIQITKSDQGGDNAGVYIRGIGQFDWLPTFDPGVGIYVDGVYLARTAGGLLDLTDLNRVEVLRGPQGTLFGKNTIGGAINVTTNSPTFTNEGNAFVRAGERNRIDAGVTLNVPVIDDTLAVRLSLLTKNQDGFGTSLVTGRKYGGEGKEVGKLSVLWKPSSRVGVDVSGDYTRVRQPIGMSLLLNLNTQTFVTIPQNQWAVAHGVTPYDERWISPSYYTNYSIWNFDDHEDTWGTSATVKVDLDFAEFKSISAYRKSRFLTGLSFDAAPSQMGDQIVDESDDQGTQEFLLSGNSFDKHLEWVTGLYYLRENIFNAVTLPLSFPANPDGYDTYTTNKAGTTSYAGYGDATLHLTDKWSFTLGARYSEERKSDTIHVIATKLGVDFLPTSSFEKSWNSFTYRAGLQYQVAESVMAYGSVSTGFKSGGFNGRANSTAFIAFDPEKAISYELGLKSELLERRLRLNLAAFQTNYRDIQTTLNLVDPATGVTTNVVQNPADARIRGLELEGSAIVADWLSLDASATTTTAEYTRLETGTIVSFSDHLPQVPSWTMNVGAELHLPISIRWVEDGLATLRIDESHRASSYDAAPNTIYNYEPHRDIVNARLSYGPRSGPWSVAAYARNLFNRQYLDFHEDLMAFVYSIGTPGPPREIGGEIFYRW